MQRHDAERRLDALAPRIRDRVDLETIGGDLVGAVAHTIPAGVRERLATAMTPPERPFIGTSIGAARRFALLVGVAGSAFAGSAVFLDALSGNAPRVGLQTADILAWATGALTYAAVGVVVAWRRPANTIGWLFLLIGFLGTTGVFGVTYAAFAQATGAPGGPIAAWYSTCETAVGSGLILNVFVLLFPTGRVPSRRWTPVLGTGLVGIALTTVAVALWPGPLLAFPDVNPLAIADATAAISLIGDVGIALLVVAVCGSIGSVFVRLVGGGAVERQQLKWMGAAVLVLLVAAALYFAQGGGSGGYGEAGGSLALDAIPVAAGIAILRYRLYDIDLLINRTLVYGGTTAVIGGAFFGGIVLLQTLLRPFTTGSELSVAASTLVSFALFQPLRRRIQRAVDQHFYRSRYDAVRTLDAFSARLGDEVELDALRGDLLTVVGDTMQPVHASLWLRR